MSRLANRMTEAVTKLASRFEGYASITVSYADGNGSTVSVWATPAGYESDGQITHDRRAFIIETADLVLDGLAVIPAAGHTITEADGTIYTVVKPDGRNQVFDRIGPTRTMLKIYTKARAKATDR